jgi:hypothetical protein
MSSEDKVHWDHTYHLVLDGEKQHRVVIYTRKDDKLLLCTGDKFNKAFGRYFEEIEGVWNGSSGWYFPVDEKSQKELFSLLKRIHTGDVPPILKEFHHTSSEKDMKKICQKIYGGLDNIFKMIPDQKDSFSIPSLEGETIFYFNRSEEDRTKGECVIKLEKNKKKVEIFQFMYV